LIEILNDVVDMFDPNGQADHIGRNSRQAELFRIQLSMGRRGRVADEGAHMNARSGESSLNASPQVIREAPNAAGRTQIPDRFAGAPRVAIAVDGAVAVTNCRPGIEEEVNIRG